MFPKKIGKHLTTVTIIGKPDHYNTTNPGDCAFEVYNDWEPLGCAPSKKSKSFEDHLRYIIGVASIDPEIFRGRNNLRHIGAEHIGGNLRQRAKDVAAAAIDADPQCFQPDAHWERVMGEDLSRDSDETNSAAMFSRHVRIQMSKPGNDVRYLGGKGREILAMGIGFEYRSEKTNEWKMCILGDSIIGENSTYSNYYSTYGKSGSPGSKRLPNGDMVEVWREILFTSALALVIVYHPNWEMTLRAATAGAVKKAVSFGRFHVLLLTVAILSFLNIKLLGSISLGGEEE
jgi:hypothetical protein